MLLIINLHHHDRRLGRCLCKDQSMSRTTSTVHPNAIVVAIFGLITAALIGLSNSSWGAGIGFGLFALGVAFIMNSILKKRQQKYGDKDLQSPR